MKHLRSLLVVAAAAAVLVTLAGCGNSSSKGSSAKSDLKSVALVTDNGGIDDHSFNQSAWEGLEKYGKDNGMKKGVNGYNYFQSSSESDYTPNLQQAVQAKYNTIFAIGFSLEQAVKDAAKQNPDTNYALVDDVITGQKNVASITFKTEQSSYLAGIAAAKTTKSNKIGFIGGMKSDVIDTFQAGFQAGVKSVNPDIKVDVQYANSFADAAKGKTIAAAMYASGADVIYVAAGATGNGVFAEAKALNEKKPAADKVWVIGVDRDQKADGDYTDSKGVKSNFTLASALKEVGAAVIDISKQAQNDKFPGGKIITYGLADKGVALAQDSMPDATWAATQAAAKDIIAGKIDIPVHPAK
jgi:basic membrane protein A